MTNLPVPPAMAARRLAAREPRAPRVSALAWLAPLALAAAAAACNAPSTPDAGPPAPVAAAKPPASARASSSSTAAASGAAAAASEPSASNHATYAANGIACQQCHPCGKRDPNGHASAWMDAASPGFHAYSANAELASCQACHGPSLDGVGGTTSVSCAQCHGAAWRTTCTGCHGGAADATGAPPRTVWGRSAETVRVGAHTSHLAATHGLSAPIACGTCHVVPEDALAPGHADGPTADVTFSGLAIRGGPATWDRTAATCTTYCHGATLAAGGALAAPVWTEAAGAARACGACHGAPPPPPHPTSAACGGCHEGYSATAVDAATHVDGAVDVLPMTCTSCHGSAGQQASAASPLYAAPPVDTSGASSGVRVGAHQRHLAGGSYASALACQACHASVGTYGTSHANGIREVGFSGAGNANLARGTWTAGTGTAAGSCSGTWCHGAVITRSGGPIGGTLTRPTWTSTVGACTACHSVTMTSLYGRHSSESSHRRIACNVCHGAGYSATVVNDVATGNAVNRATHVDGVRTIVTVSSGTGIRTWNATTRSCQPSCHGSETW